MAEEFKVTLKSPFDLNVASCLAAIRRGEDPRNPPGRWSRFVIEAALAIEYPRADELADAARDKRRDQKRRYETAAREKRKAAKGTK